MPGKNYRMETLRRHTFLTLAPDDADLSMPTPLKVRDITGYENSLNVAMKKRIRGSAGKNTILTATTSTKLPHVTRVSYAYSLVLYI
jgi:hypothetical protein